MTKTVIIAVSMIGLAQAENDWEGFYAGINAGIAFSDAQLKSQQLGFTNPSEKCNSGSNYATVFPGVQAGYLHHLSDSLMAGIEANFTINNNQTETLGCNSNINPAVYDHFEFKNQMQTSIKGRIAKALNWNNHILLPYLTAGASFANFGLTYRNEGGDYYSNTTNQTGWLVGAGLEWAFMQHWSVRAEYNYINYGTAIHLKIPSVYDLEDPNGNSHVNLNSNNVVVSINYWV